MAQVSDVLRTSWLYLLIGLTVLHVAVCFRGDISVVGEECGDQCLYKVLVPVGSSWRLTEKALQMGDVCTHFPQDYDIREQPGSRADGNVEVFVTVPLHSGKLYFCRYNSEGSPVGGEWVHHGTSVFLSGKQESTLESSPAKQNGVSEKSEDNRAQNLEELSDNSVEETLNRRTAYDLSHDIDVNNKPGAPRIPREEASDILVQQDDQYVPLSEVNSQYVDFKSSETSDSDIEFIHLPEVSVNVKKVKELGASYREPSELDNNLETIVRERRDVETATEDAASVTEQEKEEKVATADSDDATSLTEEKKEEKVATANSDDGIKAQKLQSDLGESVKHDEANTEKNNDIKPERFRSEAGPAVKITGFRIEASEKSPENDDGIPSVLSSTNVTLRLFGSGFTKNTYIGFTNDAGHYGDPCTTSLSGRYPVDQDTVEDETALVNLRALEPLINDTFYFCAINAPSGLTKHSVLLHQGSKDRVTFKTHNKPLPLWATLVLILICLMFSALFSGLNLGLMSLDRTELKIIANTGTEQERKYSRQIQPVRDHGNYLLCSILLGNVALNSTFTILLDDLMSGLFAVIFSTLAIVCLGEIVPQAICSRKGLMIGAKTIVIMKVVMGITAPIAYPISKLLDYFLGEEIGSVYNRERLKELVKVTNDLNDLDKDEVNIISGALDMRKKTVVEVMTNIEDVFMLSIDSAINFETLSEIVTSGYSRIPVYEGSRSNIVAVLFIKDLAFVDPDDNTPLRTLCHFYQNICNFVFEDTTLDVMFRQFKEGHKGHMAFVQRVNSEGEGDPFYETIGLVTLEDVIEEMIQAEIIDETDVYTDNRSKRRRTRPQDKVSDFAAFAVRREHQGVRISPQLTLATFQFLTSSVDAFKPDMVSETVLRRLLKQDIIHQIKCKGKDKTDPSNLVYTQGKPVDYFVLLLEGRVEVTVGRENLVFEAGPFTYFGVQALTQNVGIAESPTPSLVGSLQNINMDSMLRYTFVPDYSVRATTELLYIVIKRSLYLAAKRATLMERTSSLAKGDVTAGEQFDSEVDKLLSLDEDASVTGEQKTPSRQVSPSQPPPASANPVTRSTFASLAGTPTRGGNGDVTYKFPPSEQIEPSDNDK